MKYLQKKIKALDWPSCMALLICPIITFYLFDLYTHNPFTAMNLKTQFLNIIFYELMGFLLFGVFKYVRFALMLQSGIFMIVGLVNYFVLNFRSTPIMPWDIYSIQTAASVADNFSYRLEKETIMVLISFLALLVIESRFRMKAPERWRKRGILIMLPALLLWSYTGLVQSDHFVARFGLYDKLFTPTVMNRRDGNVVAFLMEMEYLNVEKPKNYSSDAVEEIYHQREQNAEELQTVLANPEAVRRPNIIVIMDEAFSDLAVLGTITTNQDYMPFMHKLQKGADNTISGFLNVSVLGGNTANSEFEFLTGNTMAFLPQGSVAYQQYVKDETPTLASYLKQLGYHTIAMHPYYADGWERERVYPLLGFEQFLSLEDFKGEKKIRNYISDEACFDKIISLYEEKEPGQPMFLFNVTMQNHSGYEDDFDNFDPSVTVEGISAKSLSTYLSLLKETDDALEALLGYFAEAEEDTMIVFFGDHQPTTYVSNPILRNNGVNPDTLTVEDNMLKYKVPYVIWSNFDIQEQKKKESSLNYLSIDVLENCGLPLPAQLISLKEVREEYPIISAVRIQDKKGENTTLEKCSDRLNAYRSMEYYLLFDYDKNNRKNIH